MKTHSPAKLPLVRFTHHAVDRYRHHVRDCDVDQARAELTHLLKTATMLPDSPGWVVRRQLSADGWLLLTPDLVCPCRALGSGNMLAVTLCARGALSDQERHWRSARKGYDRQSKRASKPKFANRGGRPRQEPTVDDLAGGVGFGARGPVRPTRGAFR